MTAFLRTIFGFHGREIPDPGDDRSGFLFAIPTFFSGYARVFDLFGGFDDYNKSRNGEEADCRAMYSDWRIVGQDIRNAACHFRVIDLKLPAQLGSLNDESEHQRAGART